MKLTQKDYDGWSSAGNSNTGAGNSSNRIKIPKQSRTRWNTESIDIIKMLDLENKLIRANKRVNKWRKEAKEWKNSSEYFENWYEIEKRFAREANIDWENMCLRKQEANLKQKKAWIAFYIATILYIVGIIIVIWKN